MTTKPKWRIIAAHIVHGWLRKTGVIRHQIDPVEERRNPPLARAEHDRDRARRTFAGYMAHFEPGIAGLSGCTVLEIGPGPNLGVALHFLAAGASRVICVDKFVPFSFTDYHAAVYQSLHSDAVNIPDRRVDENRIQYHYGELYDLKAYGSVDLIVSNAVIEEIYRLDEAFAHMKKLLKPGGRMVHKLDFTDYGLFSNFGYHPLEFLTVPDSIYRQMAEATGQPNRWMPEDYRRTLENLRMETEIEPAEKLEIDSSQVEQIRPRLLPRYQRMETRDLLMAGAFLSAQSELRNQQ